MERLMIDYDEYRKRTRALITQGSDVVFVGSTGGDKLGTARVTKIDGDRIWVEGDEPWKSKIPDGGPYHRSVLQLAGTPNRCEYDRIRNSSD